MVIGRADTRLTDELLRQFSASGDWDSLTYPTLLQRNATHFAEKVAIGGEHGQITWAQLWSDARKLAAYLIDAGVARGDVITIQLPNRIEYILALAASNLVGAVAAPLLTNLRSTEVKFVLEFSKAVMAFVPKAGEGEFDLVRMVRDLQPELPHLKQVICIGDNGMPPAGTVSLRRILEREFDGLRLDEELTSRAVESSDVSRILFTSGSTGDPKGVIHTHATTLSNNRRFNEFLQMDEHAVMLVFVPLALNLGMFHIFQAALLPCTLVLLERFDPQNVIRCIERWKITNFASPPNALLTILDDSTFAKDKVESLRFVISAGTPCPAAVQRQISRQLGCALLDGYGMTEAGWISATTLRDMPEQTEGTVGFPFPWMAVQLCDEDGREVPPGAVGEISVGGPSICVGYYNAPERNAESWMVGNRFRTGDLGQIDPSGRLRIVGRTKDLIKHGGLSVYPRELEEVLIAHPKIAEVAVVGIADSYFGENACACIVPKGSDPISLDEVVSYLKDRIAKYKLPQRLELFDQLPRTASGKIRRHILQRAVDRRVLQERSHSVRQAN